MVAHDVQIVGDEPIPEKPSIYAVIPHGTFPFGLGLVSNSLSLGWEFSGLWPFIPSPRP